MEMSFVIYAITNTSIIQNLAGNELYTKTSGYMSKKILGREFALGVQKESELIVK
jgi:hypothetical protein